VFVDVSMMLAVGPMVDLQLDNAITLNRNGWPWTIWLNLNHMN